MFYFITILTIVFGVVPIVGLIIVNLQEKKKISKAKEKNFLFDVSLPERNISPEKIFNTLDTVGIEISFSKYTNNLD